ncbi:MAG: hypothetical protein WDO69_04370 [Pseudomonadota bacterium]
MISVLQPTPLDGMTNIALIAPESIGDCLLFTDGTAKCIGSDDYGQFGSDQATTVSVKTWVDVTGLTGASWLGVSASAVYIHNTACALLATGTVECWGYDNHGNAGNGVTSLSVPLPTPILNLQNVSSLSVGGTSTRALLSDHTVKCWGSNLSANLGDKLTQDVLSPKTMPW